LVIETNLYDNARSEKHQILRDRFQTIRSYSKNSCFLWYLWFEKRNNNI